jgi:1-acyl-sn-glycerol-3-phosphate acyltransferase
MSGRPNPMPLLYCWRSNVLQAPVLAVVTVVCGTAALMVSLVEKSGRVQHRIARIWARLCLWGSWSRLTVQGKENFKKHRVAVYASNHTSYMDTPIIFASIPFQFRILAKKSLWEWPFIGWFLRRSGQMPIDTENPQATLSSLGAGVKALRAGMPLFVFPEGGRTVQGKLQPFLSGAAYLAIRAQVPLVPLAHIGGYDLLPIHTRHLYSSKLTLTVGEPIETKGMTVRQTDELTRRLRNAIKEMLGEPVESETEIAAAAPSR